ncbi:Mce family protein [Gordonia araii NBRC 100433]|uniref:Mce family protein n=1 Tax=Gordonia araii NBRC 100433 TaxID=1073574 RepID=G7GXB3_9ACTN|nr:MCE family protein [Gordonia araii]GAB08238.1 Mce family protein [Gordonia araii NBRC 100433]
MLSERTRGRFARLWGWPMAVAAAVVAVVVSAVVVSAAAPFGMASLAVWSRGVCAQFADATGLYVGNNVSMLGVTVGRVTGIEQRHDSVEVRMDVVPDLKLPSDTGAVIAASSIVTDRRVEFTKPYVRGPELSDGVCISREDTRTPKGISDALDGLNRTVSAALGTDDPTKAREGAKALEEFVNNATTIADGNAGQLNLFLAATSKALGDPAVLDTSARRMVDSLQSLTTMFVTNWPDFNKLLDNLSNTAKLIQGSTNGLGQAIAYANDFLPMLVRNIGKYDRQLYGIADALVPYAHELLKRADNFVDLLLYLPAAIGKLPGLVDPILRALLFTYKSPRFETSVNGQQTTVDLADLLNSINGGRR